MDVREKLIKLLSDNFVDFINVDIVAGNCKIRAITFNADDFADCLIANGVTITPAVPGPEIADPNIMELCFHNGERHMKEQMLVKLTALCEGLGLDYNKIVFIQRSLWDL